MVFLATSQQRAAMLLVLLGLALLVGLAPFTAGLVGAPVLYVLLQPVHERLTRHLGPRTSALLVVVLALLLLAVPGLAFLGLVVSQAQSLAASVSSSPFLDRLDQVHILGVAVGPAIADAGSALVRTVGGSAVSLVGTAARQALNVTIALFGLYYLLLEPNTAWTTFSGYLPFSDETIGHLRERFRNVTTSMVIGEGVTAVLQGTLVGLALWALGFHNVPFWSVVTVVLAVLPLVGSGMVWVPAVVILVTDHRVAAAFGLALWGLVVVANVETVVRPLVVRRYAQIHPMTTLVGALAGVPYFGILGLLIGPLAISYFFELMAVYRTEYAGGPPPASAAAQ